MIYACWTSACLLAVAATGWHRNLFPPDSWGYYEISKSIFSDFYRVNTVIQYKVQSDYSISFPPLFPTLIAIINKGFNLGVAAGIVVSSLSLVISALILLRIGREYFKSTNLGIAAIGFLLLSQAYLMDVETGMSGPVSLSLLLAVLCLFLRPPTKTTAIGMGALMALGLLNRNDLLTASCLLGMIIAMQSSKAHGALYFATLGLVLSPWLAFLHHTHGKFMVSEVAYMVKLAFANSVQDYFPQGATLPNIHSHLGPWITMEANRIWHGARGLLELRYLALVIALVAVAWWRQRHAPATPQSKSSQRSQRLLWFAPVVVIHIATILSSGIPASRYFVFTNMYLAILLASIATDHWLPRSPRYQAVTAGFLALATCSIFYNANYGLCNWRQQPCLQSGQQLAPAEATLATTLNTLAPPREVLITVGEIYTMRFGALTGLKTYLGPANNNDCLQAALIKEYKIPYAFTKGEPLAWLQRSHDITAVGANLYRIGPAKPAPQFASSCQQSYQHLEPPALPRVAPVQSVQISNPS